MRLRAPTGRRRASQLDLSLSREELKAQAREERRRLRRRRIVFAIVGALVIVAGAVLLSWWVDQNRDDDTPTEPTGVVPSEGASAVFAVVDQSGVIRSMALLAAHETEEARLVLLHPSLLVTIPGFGENLLSNAVRFDDAELLDTTITNLLGARVDQVVVWTQRGLAAAIPEPLTIDLPEPFITDDGAAQVVVAAAGEAERDGIEIARFLVDLGIGDELDLMQRQGAVWAGLLAAVRADETWVTALAGADDSAARSALVGVATGSPVLTIVPATRIEPSGSEERYQLDGEDAASFTLANLRYLQLADEPRTRVEVLNGNGRIGTTQPVAALLVDEGFRVVVTDNADRDDYATTRIIAQGESFQAAAVEAREVLGIGDVSVEIRQPSGVVDLTIIVGQDLPAGAER